MEQRCVNKYKYKYNVLKFDKKNAEKMVMEI